MSATAIVLAGERPGVDPLAAHFGGTIKALVPLGGESMVRKPVRALLACPTIAKVVVLSQEAGPIRKAVADFDRVEVGASGATIADTMITLCNDTATAWPLLVTTADHALLDAGMVEEFAARADGADIAIGVVQKARLDERLPGSNRTWLNFRGESVTGANLFWLASPKAAKAVELWRSVEQDRKKAWRVIALLGPVWLAMAAMRLAGLDDLVARLSVRLGLKVRIVRLTNPLAGIDVDSIADHALAEAILAGRA
jgi:GTP:adenosylcobinamide-phosphate guanylyltransferase